ncbi:hypothetical protein CLHUN_22220 [Ruminiclostridium hungatei]|uniref:Uncharacterized protein n=1 Tax=Ruminiclostridium hungatei TaxID=48256 RepID=A0A1V4SJA5_RUMHU|nr:hypothetical protein [Ruminiclostridium hungatei]OPX43979.1 hypothetical protein CLHUN_22220 [Ruminiclostridium hungatei]
MQNKITKLFSIFLVISLLILSNISVFADSTAIDTGNDVKVINVDITQFPEFDINNQDEYKPILEKYGISENDVIAILPVSQGSSLQDKAGNTSTASSTASVPAGVLVLTGTFVSDYQWNLTILNVGILNVSNIEADVILINNSYGPVVNSQRYLGGLSKFGSITERYSAGGYAIHVAIVTVTGITEAGEYFTMGGTQYR